MSTESWRPLRVACSGRRFAGGGSMAGIASPPSSLFRFALFDRGIWTIDDVRALSPQGFTSLGRTFSLAVPVLHGSKNMPCDTERENLGYNKLLTRQLPKVALNGESSSLKVIERIGGTVCCQDLVYCLVYLGGAFKRIQERQTSVRRSSRRCYNKWYNNKDKSEYGKS